MHEVLVNRLGGLSLPRKSVVRLTDRPDMTLDVYRGRKKTATNTRTERTIMPHISVQTSDLHGTETKNVWKTDWLASKDDLRLLPVMSLGKPVRFQTF